MQCHVRAARRMAGKQEVIAGRALSESVAMIETVKLFSREDKPIEMFERAMTRLDTLGRSKFHSQIVARFTFGMLPNVLNCTALWMAAITMRRGVLGWQKQARGLIHFIKKQIKRVFLEGPARVLTNQAARRSRLVTSPRSSSSLVNSVRPPAASNIDYSGY